ncbi:DinB family protein [Algihabitans sp.]|uniref:DinB family protein n=1 Tax=Algihabitans sp. TaxID=2821514 RepID=UPI003BA87D90
MISADYCRVLARYNSWQNTSLVTAADGLTDSQRWADQGAFFKSAAATLNHLYWADALMLERIKGNERPQDTITHSLTEPSDWSEFKSLRAARDAEIADWADSLTDRDLRGTVAWYPLDGSERIEMSKAICVVHLFNHQTHHRGQIHAMLTALGAAPEPTDIPAMPQSATGA